MTEIVYKVSTKKKSLKQLEWNFLIKKNNLILKIKQSTKFKTNQLFANC